MCLGLRCLICNMEVSNFYLKSCGHLVKVLCKVLDTHESSPPLQFCLASLTTPGPALHLTAFEKSFFFF